MGAHVNHGLGESFVEHLGHRNQKLAGKISIVVFRVARHDAPVSSFYPVTGGMPHFPPW
jgi:hypothetical protein